ncbi:3-deoxy-D-manno-octulosonic acid transferase [Sulfitobacter donghicola]|uniref:3-deoxy-D-manno-octulosonic acid transferase n=1 Tax=Sulfitobacter donghicola DSW-25 = KCTC 12864 = JCM 14565 TaxID=1300350 RepID=A0A073IJF1_9RHOB|nr:glycosyltransferase N-terminal domain-containing protein [Sulfitobacter donghicola]KEJ90443.1 3-deoxy-D-manno-octulosonic acid transferase [Sulfitobacter donghicola DSW-25 = KCTC 12864 = JCM 14565]KIN67675.1 putative 3-deoxy-d-manno-octulosonic-acid transferase protein [Sulfitobacter donghicola DSW-25 = KCTC 12864 = JCM 14565]
MARSLGLAAYRALARRGDGRIPSYDTIRPKGELLWIHCPETNTFLAVLDLALRQIASRPGLNVLITSISPPRTEDEFAATLPSGIFLDIICEDHPASVQAFLDHWSPDCCIWTWGDLRPNLIFAAHDLDIPLFLIDGEAAGFDGRRDRWLPDVARSLLPLFQAVMVRNPAAGRRLAQLGLGKDVVEVTSALRAGGHALPCNETDLAELSAACVGRAIWYANGVHQEELHTVLAAHRQALSLSHRLLLVLRPAGNLSPQEALPQIISEDFRVACWDDGQFPDETTQILLSEDPHDIGLFYRIAPVSFLGGSLVAGRRNIDPLEAAALGSAILYGPRVGRFLQSYSRLAAAGAARIINDSAALGMAVSRLVAPDQAAIMAHAGWEVVSEGAALMDKITDLVQDALDSRQGIY